MGSNQYFPEEQRTTLVRHHVTAIRSKRHELEEGEATTREMSLLGLEKGAGYAGRWRLGHQIWKREDHCEIFEASDPWGRSAAVKLRPRSQPAFNAWQNERAFYMCVNHPSIPSLLDAGSVQRPILGIELLANPKPLFQATQDIRVWRETRQRRTTTPTPTPPPDETALLLRWIDAALDALSAVHAARASLNGKLDDDASLVIDAYGELHLVGFGAAKVTNEANSVSVSSLDRAADVKAMSRALLRATVGIEAAKSPVAASLCLREGKFFSSLPPRALDVIVRAAFDSTVPYRSGAAMREAWLDAKGAAAASTTKIMAAAAAPVTAKGSGGSGVQMKANTRCSATMVSAAI